MSEDGKVANPEEEGEETFEAHRIPQIKLQILEAVSEHHFK